MAKLAWKGTVIMDTVIMDIVNDERQRLTTGEPFARLPAGE